MKILLDNNDQAISLIVATCCERVSANLKELDGVEEDYDLLIKDCDNDTNISEYNLYKTLFLLPRGSANRLSVKYFLEKPFLPNELIKFLNEFLVSNVEIDDSNENDFLSLDDLPVLDNGLDQQNTKIDEDIATIANIVNEIDKIDDKCDYDNIDENFNLDDDISLEEFAKNLDDNASLDDLVNQYENLKEDSFVDKVDKNEIIDDDINLPSVMTYDDEIKENILKEDTLRLQNVLNDIFKKHIENLDDDNIKEIMKKFDLKISFEEKK